MAVLDLPGDYASDVRPARAASGRKLWAKDPTDAGGTDGTRVDATFVNDILGLIRGTLAAFSVAANAGDDTAIAQAITAAIAAEVAGLDLESLAPIDSPAFTGTPAAPTATPGTNTTQLATTAFVAAAVAALVNSSPSTLDTLKELADALGDDPNFATTITTALGLKAPLASPALTGSPTAPTQTAGDNSTKIATTAFVAALGALKANLASPTFTGTPAAPTATPGTNTTQIATTAFVAAAIAAIATGVTSVAGLTGAVTAAGLKTALSLVKGDVGLGSVDNTADTAKPVSTAQATAIAAKLDSTGLPAAIAAISAGGIGSLATAKVSSVAFGATVAGSSLNDGVGAIGLTGTWRKWGGTDNNTYSLFVRIS